MSAAAKKMMEKMGWKEGEGLGKERAGMRTYVKVVRRDPNTATGLGHMADPNQNGNLATAQALELDSVYQQLRSRITERARDESSSSGDDDDEVRKEVDRDASCSSFPPSSTTGSTSPKTNSKNARQPQHKVRRCEGDTLSSSSSDDEGESHNGKPDVTRMNDDELFKRCGGVRLGRAGRHRFFDGKLSRIKKSHNESD